MPELPEVETVRTGLDPILTGAVVTGVELRRPDLRFPFPRGFAAGLSGSRISKVGRRAKYLILETERDAIVPIHLGMTGSLRVVLPEDGTVTEGFRPQHDHVVLSLSTDIGERKIVYNDPRRFGYMMLLTRQEFEAHSFFAGLGPEPLEPSLDLEAFAESLRRGSPLKVVLLDQRVMAGLGNIYVCEALWRSGLSPDRTASSIADKPKVVAELARHVRDVLSEAIAAGGSTLKDYRKSDGSRGNFQERFDVYGRAGLACRRKGCRGHVQRSVHAGRATFHCVSCQSAG